MHQKKVLACIHSTSVVVQPLTDASRKVIPEADVWHICDDSLLRGVRSEGCLTLPVARRYVQYVVTAEENGADAVMVTCSSCNRVAPLARPLVRVPVFSIDEAMAEDAVSRGSRIGVVATLGTTLEPTAALIEEKAREAGRNVTIRTHLADRAFDRLSAGDPAGHDQILTQDIHALARESDVVVLAQVSMARIVPLLGADVAAPVLTSALSGFARARRILGIDS